MSIAERSKAFTVKSIDEQLVFIRAGLSANDRRLLLAHELGHIVLGHMSDCSVLGYTPAGLIDEGQEDEANESALEFLAAYLYFVTKAYKYASAYISSDVTRR